MKNKQTMEERRIAEDLTKLKDLGEIYDYIVEEKKLSYEEGYENGRDYQRKIDDKPYYNQGI